MEKWLKVYWGSGNLHDALKIPKSKEIVFEPLGRGEYNVNYSFIHPITNEKLVLRLNTASQMALENQIEYEYQALEFLEKSGRTPKVYYVDGSKTVIPFGILVMEYLEGRSLDYKTDLERAAAIFADIHSLSIEGADFLLKPKDLLQAMLAECRKMAEVYLISELGEKEVKNLLENFLHHSEKKVKGCCSSSADYRIINTEVNSGNFIITEDVKKCYLIDWEKPILGEVEQDIAHFIAPTTTFWKTDILLSPEEQAYFIRSYQDRLRGGISVERMEEKLQQYLPLTCLRGITWCAMAWIYYQDEGQRIRNEDTYKKLKEYLSKDFLEKISIQYF